MIMCRYFYYCETRLKESTVWKLTLNSLALLLSLKQKKENDDTKEEETHSSTTFYTRFLEEEDDDEKKRKFLFSHSDGQKKEQFNVFCLHFRETSTLTEAEKRKRSPYFS